jgi:hypothetical protein
MSPFIDIRLPMAVGSRVTKTKARSWLAARSFRTSVDVTGASNGWVQDRLGQTQPHVLVQRAEG